MTEQFYFVFQLLLVVEAVVALVVEGEIWVLLVNIWFGNFVAVLKRFVDVGWCWATFVDSRAI